MAEGGADDGKAFELQDQSAKVELATDAAAALPDGGTAVVVEEETESCRRPHICNEFSALAQKHAKQRCGVKKGGCFGKCAIVCTLIEMCVPIVLSLSLWLIYYLVDENVVVSGLQMQQYAIQPGNAFTQAPTSAAPNVDMPLALKVAGQRIAFVKGEYATWAEVRALEAALDVSFPGFDLAEATLDGCANEVWNGAEDWQFAMAKDLPPYMDPPAVSSNVTIPKLSDVIVEFEDQHALNDHVRDNAYNHDIYAAIVLDQAGNAANGNIWRYVLRMHVFRGMGVYTGSGNSDEPLNPAGEFGERSYFMQGPWQTGIASTDGGDRSNNREAQRENTFIRAPLPSYAALQLAIDRAIIDTTKPFEATLRSGKATVTLEVSDTYMQNLATNNASVALNLIPQLLSAVTSPYFGSVLGRTPWQFSSGRLAPGGPGTTTAPTPAPKCDISTLSAAQQVSLAQAYGRLNWAGTGRIPHAIEVDTMPSPEYLDPTFYDSLAFIVPIFYILIYLLPVFNQIRATVAEKETRLAEGMLIMGMNEACRQAMWMVVFALQHTVVALFVTIGLCNPSGAFGRSDFTLVFCLFALYGLAVTAFGNFIALFFERAKTAAVIGTFIFLVGLAPFMTVIIYGQILTPEWGQVISCLMVPSAFGLGISQIASYQAVGGGLTWENMYVLVNNMRFVHCLYMLVVDIFLLLVLGWWIDKWNPLRTIGTKQRPWFCFLPQYWCPRSAAAAKCRKQCDRDGEEGGETSDETDSSVAPETDEADGVVGGSDDSTEGRAGRNHFEEFTVDQKYRLEKMDCIKVRGLVKRFRTPDGIKTAVDKLDMTLFDGEIFVLLGHNGAGKTTTISMLSGLLRPSSGRASILGMNVWTQMGSIRRQMGVCPQQNVLFEDLTCEEHLWMFGRLKGVSFRELREQVRMRLRDVGMMSKAKSFTGALSGGQKRKICLAISLMGDSKVLFLDEPTSGMDVFAQRSVWALLRKLKKNRIIVLTTHSMEEADMLGDRIGIMAEGKMVCCGTPLFLKSLYGVGYSLIVTTIATEDGHAFVQDIVRRHVPEATQHEGAANVMSKELSFQLPFTAAQRFEAMFTEFDVVITDEEDFRIEAYGISVTTMEEVFLKSAHDAHSSLDSEKSAKSTSVRLPLSDLPESESTGSSDAVTSGLDAVTGRAVVEAQRTRVQSGLDSGAPPLPLESNASIDADVSSPSANGVDNPARRTVLSAATKGAEGVAESNDDGGRAMMEQKLQHIKELQKFGFCRQLGALLLRRIAYARRDIKLALFQFAIPLLVMVFGLGLLVLVGLTKDQPGRTMLEMAEQFNNVRGVSASERGTVLPYINNPYSSATALAMPSVTPNVLPSVPLRIQTAERSKNWVCSEVPDESPGLLPFAMQIPGLSPVGAVSEMCEMGKYLLETHDKKPDGSGKGGTTYLAIVQNTTKYHYRVLVNMSNCKYCPAIGLGLANTALFREHSGNAKAQIIMEMRPMANTKNALSSSQQVTGILFAIVLLLGWAFIPAAFVEFIVRERQLGVKHQMLISGTSIFSYWTSNLFFDFILSVISLAMVMIILVIFAWAGNIEIFQDAETYFAFVILIAMYFVVCAPMMYFASWFFSNPSVAINLTLVAALGNVILVIAGFAFSVLKITCREYEVIKYFLLLFPPFAFGDGIWRVATIGFLPLLDNACDAQWEGDSFDASKFGETWSALEWRVIGPQLTYMACMAPVLLILAVVFDFIAATPALQLIVCKLCTKMQNKAVDSEIELAEDPDVAAEMKRVNDGDDSMRTDVVRVLGLRRAYGIFKPKLAVKNLEFGIRHGECFGLLGVNGAGKSTTMKMLTADVLPTRGTVRCVYSISSAQ